MDYTELAMELLEKMKSLRKIKPHKNMNEAMQGETFVLTYIAHHGGDVLPGEIGHEMDVSSARIASALNSLEKKGLITRQIDTNDRRKILVGITQEGKEIAENHYKKTLEIAAKMLELLGEHDAKEYIRVTKKLVEVLPDCKNIF